MKVFLREETIDGRRYNVYEQKTKKQTAVIKEIVISEEELEIEKQKKIDEARTLLGL